MPKDQLVVELALPLAGMECDEVRFFDGNGKRIDAPISRIEIVPYFIRRDAGPTVLYTRTVVEGSGPVREICKSVIAVSGSTGDLRVKGQLASVVPKCMAPDAEGESQETGEEGAGEEDDVPPNAPATARSVSSGSR